MLRILLGVLLVVSVVASCGGVDHDIEGHVTIEQGVYGLLISGCEMSGCEDQPAIGEEVVVFAAGSSGYFSKVRSDDNGVYQINLVAGDYTLCISSCTTITVPTKGKIRVDWTSGPGGGHWSASE